ncbi:uncharacterized protein LOC131168151 [Malania oleifera]|uniref:uncharacterized protein LOC131168151 n=1 Tax=Malania oleifera TaxID=397392 RepID=UPI0025AEB387|nr:uncharacterized protein LOC131168151 [Malania oleifera]
MATNTASTDNFDDPSHVFHLSNSDNPSIVLVFNLLIETNYNIWSQYMVIALSTKNKVGFVDGTISKPSKTSSVEYQQWNRCNNMIDLKEHFSQFNGPRMYHPKQEIHNLVQGNTFVATYFTRLKLLWDELSSLQSNLFKGDVAPYQQYQRTMKFLMGLNDSYGAICGQILLMDPLPMINHIYNLILQEDIQRNIQNTSPIDGVALAAKGILLAQKDGKPFCKPRPKCTYCNREGHIVDRCYFIQGLPSGSYKTSSSSKPCAHQVFSASNNLSTSNLPFTLDQC